MPVSRSDVDVSDLQNSDLPFNGFPAPKLELLSFDLLLCLEARVPLKKKPTPMSTGHS
jgi:hypothetical protein